MEALGVAASVLTVIELSAKVVSLCVQYSLAVKGAKKEITRLETEVKDLGKVVGDVQHLIGGPDGAELSASQKLLKAVHDCFMQLKALEKTLDPGKTRKAISHFGVRALRWPFESREIEKVIGELERCKETFSLALQVDQT